MKKPTRKTTFFRLGACLLTAAIRGASCIRRNRLTELLSDQAKIREDAAMGHPPLLLMSQKKHSNRLESIEPLTERMSFSRLNRSCSKL